MKNRIKERKILELTITDVTDLGEGWTYIETENGQEQRIFVPFTCPDEKIKVELTQESKKFSRGRITEILEENSSVRVKPKCKHFHKCGGCTLQHLGEDFYYKTKIKLLENTVKRIGFTPEEREEIVKNIEIKKTGYKSRRRVNFKIDGEVLGFYKHNTNDLISIDECPILEPELEALIPLLKQFLKTNNKKKIITGVKASLIDNGIDLCFEIEKNLGAKLAEQLKNIAIDNKNIIAIKFFIDKKGYPLFQKEIPYIEVEGVKIEMPTDYFLQASVKGQEHIVQKVLELLSTDSKQEIRKVADLYSGVGTYTFPIAKKLNIEVTAIEGSADMTESVRKNSINNNLQNKIITKTRDLFSQPLQPDELNKFDAVIMNPPRNGAGSQAATLAKSDVKTIVMVSCNPSSFLRDSRILREGGYKITSLIGVDQFYMSSHLEVVAKFEK